MSWRQLPAIWREAGLAPTEKLVLLALAYHANGLGESAYPAQATLAQMCGVSLPTIKRALRSLRNRRLIVPDGKGRKGTIRYSIALPLAAQRSKAAGSSAIPPQVSPAIYNPIKI